MNPGVPECWREREPYEANPVCVCGHPASHHDAGCCWTDAEGNESWEFDGCTCLGFEVDE